MNPGMHATKMRKKILEIFVFNGYMYPETG